MAKIKKAEAQAKIERFLQLQALIKASEAELETLKAELKALAVANESRTYVCGTHTVSVTTASRKGIDIKTLEASHPKIAAKFVTATPYDIVRIK